MNPLIQRVSPTGRSARLAYTWGVGDWSPDHPEWAGNWFRFFDRKSDGQYGSRISFDHSVSEWYWVFYVENVGGWNRLMLVEGYVGTRDEAKAALLDCASRGAEIERRVKLAKAEWG
jgi:hypothetical protein